MNPIDAAVNFFSPEAGLARFRARAAARAVMNYDAASKGPRTQAWKAPATSGDSAAYGRRGQLRNLSRDMIRNRPIAARAQQVVVGAVVGTGIVPSIHAPAASPDEKAALEAVLQDHLNTPKIDALREMDLAQLQEVVMRTVFSDGEVLVRRRPRTLIYERDLHIPVQIELIEADQLDTRIQSWGQNRVVEGVEIGPIGRIVAYHILDRHPGDITFIGTSTSSTRVLASDVLHIRRGGRPGQLRGVPWLAPVMLTLGEISDYAEAQILKQRMAGLLAGVIETEDDRADADTSNLEEIAPGTIVKAPSGATVKFTDPPRVDGYGDFIGVALRQIAAGLGITYEALSGDLSNVNFTSGRMGHMVQDRNVEAWQKNIMIAQFCAGVTRWLIDAWRTNTRLPKPTFSVEWTPPRRPIIDPTKEIPAMAAEVEAGLSSRQRQQRRLGYDPDTIRRERAEDQAKDKEAQLAPSGNAVMQALALGGAERARPAGKED